MDASLDMMAFVQRVENLEWLYLSVWLIFMRGLNGRGFMGWNYCWVNLKMHRPHHCTYPRDSTVSVQDPMGVYIS